MPPGAHGPGTNGYLPPETFLKLARFFEMEKHKTEGRSISLQNYPPGNPPAGVDHTPLKESHPHSRRHVRLVNRHQPAVWAAGGALRPVFGLDHKYRTGIGVFPAKSAKSMDRLARLNRGQPAGDALDRAGIHQRLRVAVDCGDRNAKLRL